MGHDAAHRDTKLPGSGGGAGFPSTAWSRVLNTRDRADLEYLIRAYWKPVYVLIRRRWSRSNEDAKDLTQQFFATLLEKEVFDRIESGRGRFRNFLRVALENFMRKDHRSAEARSNRARFSFLEDVGDPDLPAPPSASSFEAEFDAEWLRVLLEESARRLRELYQGGDNKNYFRGIRSGLVKFPLWPSRKCLPVC